MPLYRPKAPRRPLQSADAACLFGRRLQRLVEAAHLEGKARFTDTEIAAYVGVSGQYIRNLRGGKSMPSVEKAQRLAEFFGVDHADYFLKPDDDPAVVATERRLRSHKDARPEETAPWRRTRRRRSGGSRSGKTTGSGRSRCVLGSSRLKPEARCWALWRNSSAARATPNSASRSRGRRRLSAERGHQDDGGTVELTQQPCAGATRRDFKASASGRAPFDAAVTVQPALLLAGALCGVPADFVRSAPAELNFLTSRRSCGMR